MGPKSKPKLQQTCSPRGCICQQQDPCGSRFHSTAEPHLTGPHTLQQLRLSPQRTKGRRKQKRTSFHQKATQGRRLLGHGQNHSWLAPRYLTQNYRATTASKGTLARNTQKHPRQATTRPTNSVQAAGGITKSRVGHSGRRRLVFPATAGPCPKRRPPCQTSF